MHINGIDFLVTTSRHIMFATGSMIKNRKVENFADGITHEHKLYLQRGFNITHMHTDCEFEPLRKEMTAKGINLNCASKKEHVPEIDPKNGRGDKMHYNELGYSFERNGGSGGSDALLNGPYEAINFRDMLLFGCTV